MISIIVFSQNLKLSSLKPMASKIKTKEVIFVTTHLLFDFERRKIERFFKEPVRFAYLTFAELLTDAQMEACDQEAFRQNIKNPQEYFDKIKELKNERIVRKLKQRYGNFKGYILSDDLGICLKTWLRHGFRYRKGRYYYDRSTGEIIKNALYKKKWLVTIYRNIKNGFRKKSVNKREFYQYKDKVFTGQFQQKKYVFMGRLERIGYRMDIEWKQSDEECRKLLSGVFEDAGRCQYLTTLHEAGNSLVPDDGRYDVRYIQDGYLPPNYTSRYLAFRPSNVKYYAWDVMGEQMFRNMGLEASLMPFRKKLYLPEPVFPKKVCTVLIAASGSGDWTALKNRSDEDRMAQAVVSLAKRFPEIRFLYRCHPVWVHPLHQGVNSIKRYVQYFASLGLSNLVLSGNIPDNDIGDFKLSLSRGSLDKDLEEADLVFGEHSIAMVDGALMGIPFASVNMTGRRNFFCALTNLGFPHFEDVSDISKFISRIAVDKKLQDKYRQAVERYNRMTDAG